jgi:hypothetical protein
MAGFVALGLALTGVATARAGYTTIWNNGPSANRVDMVIMGDGYTSAQLTTVYPTHIQNLLSYMFDSGHAPFPRYKNFFNVHRIDLVSNESGADVPPDEIFRDTAIGGTYYFNGTSRALYVNEVKANIQLSANLKGAPFAAEIRFVPINDSTYGGQGRRYTTFAAENFYAGELALHELAHSFSGLADEYVFDGPGGTYVGPEPTQPNITTSPTGDKWAQWLGYSEPGIGTIGAYEGASNYDTGLFRPSLDSKMRSVNRPFDAVSREHLILTIYDYVNPLDAWRPNTSTIGDDSPLWVDVVDPAVIKTQWYVNDALVDGALSESFSLRDFGFGNGTYDVKARAYDDTPWVRRDLSDLEQQVSWSVTLVPEPATLPLFGWAAVALCGVRLTLRAKAKKRHEAVCLPLAPR